MNVTQLKALLASYGRSVLGGVLALYMSGVTDFSTLAYSLVAALAPVALRAINPNDTAFGRLPAVAEVAAATTNIVAKKPVKKAAASAKKTK